MHRLFAPALLAAALVLGGCHDMTHAVPKPVHGFVTDMPAFDGFIATHPTPAQFHGVYPGVQLVMPGAITTMEVRSNNSRYFPELDKDGRIVPGHFG